MGRYTVLAVDDDPHIREVVGFALENAGMAVRLAADGRAAMDAIAEAAPDLVVLDVGMPEMDGLEVCREIRKTSDLPILFLSARDEEIDRILGLEMGADDYVAKPFSPRELVARIRSILRRSAGGDARASHDVGEAVTHGDLVLDPASHGASVAGQPVVLTALEFRVLLALAQASRRVLSRPVLLDTAWPDNIHVSDRTIDSHVRNIRAKCAAAGSERVIETVHGVGFRLGDCKAGG